MVRLKQAGPVLLVLLRSSPFSTSASSLALERERLFLLLLRAFLESLRSAYERGKREGRPRAEKKATHPVRLAAERLDLGGGPVGVYGLEALPLVLQK